MDLKKAFSFVDPITLNMNHSERNKLNSHLSMTGINRPKTSNIVNFIYYQREI